MLFIGLVADKKVDFAISIFGMREDRAKVVDYLISHAATYMGYIYIKNPHDTYDWTVYFQPLYREAWIGLILFTVVVPVLIAVVAFFRELSIFLQIDKSFK